MEIGHYDQVTALWRRCEGLGLSSADEAEEIDGYLRRNPGLSLVASHEGEIIGTILCGHDGRRGYIHHLAVDQRYRRQSIGRKLVSQALELLRDQGIRKCHLFVFANNKPAMKFWRALGFTDRIELSIMSKIIVDEGGEAT